MKRTRVNKADSMALGHKKRIRVNRVLGRAQSSPSKFVPIQTSYVITPSGFVTIAGGRVIYG